MATTNQSTVWFWFHYFAISYQSGKKSFPNSLKYIFTYALKVLTFLDMVLSKNKGCMKLKRKQKGKTNVFVFVSF
jgi:hypothetical protein